MRKLLALILMVLITACSGVDDLVQQDINKATVTDLSTVGTPTKIDMGTSTRITKRAYDSYNLLDYDTLNKCYCEWKYVDGRDVCLPMYILPTDTGLFVDKSCSLPLFRTVEPTERGEEFCGRFYARDGRLKLFKWTRTEQRSYWFFLKNNDLWNLSKTCTGANPLGIEQTTTILDPVELSLNDLATK